MYRRSFGAGVKHTVIFPPPPPPAPLPTDPPTPSPVPMRSMDRDAVLVAAVAQGEHAFCFPSAVLCRYLVHTIPAV